MAVDRAKMEAQLIMHEGLRLMPYRCSKRKLTVLVGYNIDARGWNNLEMMVGRKLNSSNPHFTREEAIRVLHADIDSYEGITASLLPIYNSLSEVRQRVCLDMAFNLGHRATGFRNAIRCLTSGDYDGTAREMLNSKWAYDVGDGPGHHFDRAERLAEMMRTNSDYTR